MRRAGFNGPISSVVQELRESEFKDDTFNLEEDAVTNGGFFNAKDLDKTYFFVFHNHHLTVYKKGCSARQSTVVLNYYFNDTASIMSVKYFRVNEKVDGALVAVRDVALDANYVSFISFQTKKQHKACLFNAKISHVHVCVDGVAIKETTGLSNGLAKYPHVLVVGGEESYAALFHMGVIPEEPCEDSAKFPSKCVSLIKPDEQGNVEYATDLRSGSFRKESAEVTSLCYVNERRVIAVGLSNGMVSLSSLKTGIVGYLYIGKLFEVLEMTWQDSVDDNDKCVFLWAYIRRTYDNQHVLCLFSNSGAVGNTEISWIRRFHYIIRDCSELVLLKAVILDKQQAAAIGLTDDVDGEDSLNTTNGPVEGYSSIMIFMYVESIDGAQVLKGCLFDLDAYYTKRMPAEPIPDRTPARQCGFLSFFKAPNNISFKPSDVLDGLVTGLTRFKRPASIEGHRDQLFYPSSLNFSMDILTTTKLCQMDVTCIQDQVVGQIERDIVEHFENPEHASSFLYALGLTNSLPDQNDIVMKSCIFRILLNNHYLGLLRIVTDTTIPKEILIFIDKWLFKELEACKSKLESEHSMIISEPLKNIPKTTFEYLTHSRSVFRRSSKIFSELANRFESLNLEQAALTRVKAHAKVASDFVLVASGYLFGIHTDFLRQTEENVEILNKLRLEFAKRSSMARHLDVKLEIHQILDEIYEANREEIEESLDVELGSEMYPPECFLNFFAILPLFNISEAAKLSIVGYFAKDLDLVDKHSDWNYFDRACSYFLNENMTSEKMKQMLDVWSSDYKLLTIGKLAETPGMVELKLLSDQDGEECIDEKDLMFMPCETHEEKVKLLELYSQLPFGVAKYNKDMICRKRYDLLVELPPKTDEFEPEFVKEVRLDLLKIKKQFPFAFSKNSFPPEILERCRQKGNEVPRMVLTASSGPAIIEIPSHMNSLFPEEPIPIQFPSQDSEEKKENEGMVTPPSRHSYLLPQITPPSHRRTMTSTPVSVKTTTTPVRDREGVLLSSALRSKDMARIKKMTTPLSVRKRVSIFATNTTTRFRRTVLDPQTSTPVSGSMSTPPVTKRSPPKPTSILRRTGSTRSKAVSEQRIQFTKTKKIHHIPSNAENRRAQNAENSFTEFSKFDDSTASEMSQHSVDNEEPDRSLNFDEGNNSDDENDELYTQERAKESSPGMQDEEVSLSPREISPDENNLELSSEQKENVDRPQESKIDKENGSEETPAEGEEEEEIYENAPNPYGDYDDADSDDEEEKKEEEKEPEESVGTSGVNEEPAIDTTYTKPADATYSVIVENEDDQDEETERTYSFQEQQEDEVQNGVEGNEDDKRAEGGEQPVLSAPQNKAQTPEPVEHEVRSSPSRSPISRSPRLSPVKEIQITVVEESEPEFPTVSKIRSLSKSPVKEAAPSVEVVSEPTDVARRRSPRKSPARDPELTSEFEVHQKRIIEVKTAVRSVNEDGTSYEESERIEIREDIEVRENMEKDEEEEKGETNVEQANGKDTTEKNKAQAESTTEKFLKQTLIPTRRRGRPSRAAALQAQAKLEEEIQARNRRSSLRQAAAQRKTPENSATPEPEPSPKKRESLKRTRRASSASTKATASTKRTPKKRTESEETEEAPAAAVKRPRRNSGARNPVNEESLKEPKSRDHSPQSSIATSDTSRKSPNRRRTPSVTPSVASDDSTTLRRSPRLRK
ncbi:unnamed protein product [Bursaphelenchus xylophilus]|uniref:(pine wood nematode) hypothetical protein n=1 Tax=Bursaphelenchus xylophilus TaxID=6326 RepID=A0A7I8X6M0_BURXY|nr:unnamed protein product [Bursaphelenchus xylophilus]CAG9122937.1 unnamed protein product [Bursaphelenchus xylophilus]